MTGGLLVVTAIYLFINFAPPHILPATDIVKLGENATGTAAGMLFGDIGGKLISVGIIVSIFGCLNGKILAFPRVSFAMAERKQPLFAGQISRVHPTFRTPWIAVSFQIALAIIFMIASNPDKLSEISIFMIYIFTSWPFSPCLSSEKKRRKTARLQRAFVSDHSCFGHRGFTVCADQHDHYRYTESRAVPLDRPRRAALFLAEKRQKN